MFLNREDAGLKLAKKFARYNKKEVVVLALPRGGVVVGNEIAKFLNVPLTPIVSKKLGAPHNPEFGIGAIAEGGGLVLDKKTIALLGLSDTEVKILEIREQQEVERRIKLYREGKPLFSLRGKTVILVDDGLATGVTAMAAIKTILKMNPKKLIFAAPVCALDTSLKIENKVDKVICLLTPRDFISVGSWFKDFKPISDQKVVNILQNYKEE